MLLLSTLIARSRKGECLALPPPALPPVSCTSSELFLLKFVISSLDGPYVGILIDAEVTVEFEAEDGGFKPKTLPSR